MTACSHANIRRFCTRYPESCLPWLSAWTGPRSEHAAALFGWLLAHNRTDEAGEPIDGAAPFAAGELAKAMVRTVAELDQADHDPDRGELGEQAAEVAEGRCQVPCPSRRGPAFIQIQNHHTISPTLNARRALR